MISKIAVARSCKDDWRPQFSSNPTRQMFKDLHFHTDKVLLLSYSIHHSRVSFQRHKCPDKAISYSLFKESAITITPLLVLLYRF